MLSRKQCAFVEHYLITFNAAEAARRAGYSVKTARSIGSENLTKPDIAELIAERLRELAMTAAEVLWRLTSQARAEYAAYIQDDGGIDLAGMIADGKAHLIKSIRQTANSQQIEFHDAQTALIWMGKHYGLFSDRLEHGGAGVTTLKVVYTSEDFAEARRLALETEAALLGDLDTQQVVMVNRPRGLTTPRRPVPT